MKKEQLELFDEIVSNEEKLNYLILEREKISKIIKANFGAINGGFYAELTDEFAENLDYLTEIKRIKNEILRLLEIGFKRDYHKIDTPIEK